MNKKIETPENVEDVSDAGLGTSLLIHVLNDVTETARRKGMMTGFVLGTCITTFIQMIVYMFC